MSPIDYNAIVSDAGALDRQAKTDIVGHYQLQGVKLDWGVTVFHADYGGTDYHVDVKKGKGLVFEVDLPPIDRGTLHGIVRDAIGQPLEGVTVFYNGKSAQTRKNGAYALECVLGHPGQHNVPAPTYSKEGYVTRQLVTSDADKDALVVMERQIALEGQVLGADGLPVQRFALYARPDIASAGYRAEMPVERVFSDTEGRFKIWLDHDGTAWVGVRAEGYASWDALIKVRRGG